MQLSFKSYRRRRVTTKNASVVLFIVACVAAFSEPLHFSSWIWVSLVPFHLAWMTSWALLLVGVVCQRQIISFVLECLNFSVIYEETLVCIELLVDSSVLLTLWVCRLLPLASMVTHENRLSLLLISLVLTLLLCCIQGSVFGFEQFDCDASRWGSLGVSWASWNFWLCWSLLSWIVNCKISALSGLWMYVVCYPGWSVFRDKHCACHVSQLP